MPLVINKNHLFDSLSKLVVEFNDKSIGNDINIEKLACIFLSSYDNLIKLDLENPMDVESIEELVKSDLYLFNSGALPSTLSELSCSKNAIFHISEDESQFIFTVDDYDVSYFKKTFDKFSALAHSFIVDILESDLEILCSTKLKLLKDSYYKEPVLNITASKLTNTVLKHYPGMTDFEGQSVLNLYTFTYSEKPNQIKLNETDIITISEGMTKYLGFAISPNKVQKILSVQNPIFNRVAYQLLRFVKDTYYYELSITNAYDRPKTPLIQLMIRKEIADIAEICSGLIAETKSVELSHGTEIYFEIDDEIIEKSIEKLQDMRILHELVIEQIVKNPMNYYDLLLEISGRVPNPKYTWFTKAVAGKAL